MATCSVPDIDVDQSSGSQADRGGRWRLTDLGVRPLNVYDELTYEFTWCGQMGDRSRLGIIWIGCHKSFSSQRRSSDNDSSLPPGLQRGLNPWPRDTSAMLYQMSYEATDVAFTATIICSFSLFHFISAVHIWFISLSLTNQGVVPDLPVVDLDQYN